MKFLLPNHYKKIGVVAAPLGFALWLSMQKGYVANVLTYFFAEGDVGIPGTPFYIVKAILAITSFFSFLGGMYLLSFSKEKLEDEMVQRTRLDSLLFAALVQIISIIVGFILFILAGEPGKDIGLLLFFIIVILLFWFSYIGRFNYVLHVKLKQ